ncbi:MAG: cytochrome c biogenesis protein CcsA [Sporomusaceae bacterium]|jgi:cytochrome c-type biogenesis protein CcmF|nr:cytochrome c biogenesis protein CcsA [Sporomusaceae bacterium]
MIGYGALGISLFLTAISVFFYFYAYLLQNKGRFPAARETKEIALLKKRGQTAYILAALGIFAAAAFLMAVILGSDFAYAYVAGYSSLDLPFAYKFAAFWAGQEGSFLLWVSLQAMFGLFLIRQKAPTGAMAVYGLLQAGLLSLLTYKSPFMLLLEPRADGLGLNPLLQDPWMVVHPPVLFLGYAALAVPFAYLLANILNPKNPPAYNKILSWTIFSFAALGAGMFIGGYWAYKVLGWGGYWAWDPVENSSLVPWLISGAFIHLLILARRNKAAWKVCAASGIFALTLVLYGTYLTRSGVLSDFSTHSFANEGIGGYLGLFTILVAVASFALLIFKWQALPGGDLYPALKSREFLLAFAALVLAMLGALVFIGMSVPLVTMSFGNPTSVNPSFYNSTSLPVALCLSILLAYAPLVAWHGKEGARKKNYWVFAFLLPGFALAWFLKLGNPVYILILAFASAALVTNAAALKTHSLSRAAAISHVGAAVLLIGIIASSAGAKTEAVEFQQGQPLTVLDKEITYLGTEEAANGQGFYQNFAVRDLKSGTEEMLRPLTKLNKNNAPAAREPGIYRSMTEDLYLAPVHEHSAEDYGTEITLTVSEEFTHSGLIIKSGELKMAASPMSGMVIETPLEITETASGQREALSLKLTSRAGSVTSTDATLFARYKITLVGVSPNENKIMLGIKDTTLDPAATLKADIMTKPLINLVWLGTIIITLGGLIGVKKY